MICTRRISSFISIIYGVFDRSLESEVGLLRNETLTLQITDRQGPVMLTVGPRRPRTHKDPTSWVQEPRLGGHGLQDPYVFICGLLGLYSSQTPTGATVNTLSRSRAMFRMDTGVDVGILLLAPIEVDLCIGFMLFRLTGNIDRSSNDPLLADMEEKEKVPGAMP